MRFYSRARVLKARDRLARYWRETVDLGEDPVHARVIAWLNDRPLPPEPTRRRPRRSLGLAGYQRALALLMGDGIDFGRPVRVLPERTIYVDIGHNGISHDLFVRWLKLRPDISPVFMLHDAIPLDFPEMVPPLAVEEHRRVLVNAATYGQAIITPTVAAAQSIHARFATMGKGNIPIHPIALPIDAAFARGTRVVADKTVHPYLIICGAIEVRKNHALLLDVWQKLIAAHGAAAPRLVIAGRPGFGGEAVIARIRQTGSLQTHVIVASGLSTPAIARLIAGARALLMPSFAEGFGLPPVEALTLGTPTILSDIAAHREATEGLGLYLSTDDVAGWQSAIETATTDTPDYVSTKARIAGYRPLDWDGYMARVSAILRDL
jgi:glycosyltransferase involved in cell wall biosynthesis